jgi:uncharacterized protein YdaU (DUF1376 family)
MKWYKRDPDAFLVGVRGLTLEETGAYAILLELTYSRDGDLPDDDALILRHLGCHWRTWKAIKRNLIDKGKIRLEGSKIVSRRVQECLKEASEFAERQSNRAKKRWQSKADECGPAMPIQPQPQDLDPEEGSRSTRSKRSRARIPFPSDWRPADWSNIEFERFRDHAIANGRLCAGTVGWEAAWRNWKTSPYRRQNNGTGHRSAAADRAYELADEWRRREAEISGTPHDAGSHRPGRPTD